MTGPGDGSPFGLSVMRQPGDDPRRRLRPVPMSSVFEISARILRRHWAVLLAMSALVGLPAALLGAAAGIPFGEALMDVLPDPDSSAAAVVTEAQARRLGEGLLIATVGSLVAGIVAVIAAVGFAWVVFRDYHGLRVSFSDTIARSVGRAIPALATALVAALATLGLMIVGGIAVAATLALLAPGGPSGGGIGVFLAIVLGVVTFLVIVVVSVRWALAISIVAIEPVGALAALRRSWRLTGEATWRTFFALVLVNLVIGLLGAVVTQVLAIVVIDLIAQPAGMSMVGETLVSTLVTVLFAPVSTVVMTVYLFDQMVRRDGWDLPAPEPTPSPWEPGAPGA